MWKNNIHTYIPAKIHITYDDKISLNKEHGESDYEEESQSGSPDMTATAGWGRTLLFSLITLDSIMEHCSVGDGIDIHVEDSTFIATSSFLART